MLDSLSLDHIEINAPLSDTIASLELRLSALVPANDHERFALAALEEAICALREGNYGIGAVVVADGKIVVREHNRVLFPVFDSKAHAEMLALDKMERMGIKGELYGTLEWCPMCYTRTLLSGVPKAFFVADDPGNGMVWQIRHFRRQFWSQSIWHAFATDGRVLGQASVRHEYKQLGWDMFALTREKIDLQLGARTPETALAAR
jgi:tRNA(Arg) A34 adenosine deaminase TadA